MFKFISTFFLVSTLLGLTSCGGSSSEVNLEDKLDQLSTKIFEINKLEDILREKYEVMFKEDLITINNGVTTYEYQVDILSCANEDDCSGIVRVKVYKEVIEVLYEYIGRVNSVLYDYPEDEYFFSGRTDITQKSNLCNKLIEKLEIIISEYESRHELTDENNV